MRGRKANPLLNVLKTPERWGGKCCAKYKHAPPKSGQSPGTLVRKMSEEKPEDRCFLCGEAGELQEHHLVPKFMTKFYPDLKGRGGTMDLCPTCHDKVHYLLKPIRLALKHEVDLNAQEENDS